MHFAAEAGNIKILIALLHINAKIDHTDANGIPPLFTAIKGLQTHNKPEHVQAIKILLAAGAYTFPEEPKLWDLVKGTHNQEVINLLAPYFTRQKIG